MHHDIWKYVRGTVKHRLTHLEDEKTVCGVSLGFDPDSNWFDDEKGLSERSPCKRCERIWARGNGI
jgi:hypothetical protein